MLRLTVITLLLISAGCSTFRPAPADAILGRWSSEVGGYPVIVAYEPSQVLVEGGTPTAYQLDGNELRFQDGGSQMRLVRFPSRDEMIQTDPMTGTEYLFTRID